VSPLLDALTEYALGSLGLVDTGLPPVAPRAQARESLLAALSSSERFRPFVPDLCRHLDLAEARVLELLARLDEGTHWEPSPLPGLWLLHFQGGPNAVAHDTGFVRFAKGLRFPYHRHLGPEVNYVLQGAIRDGDGTLYVAGEAIVNEAGSAHDYVTSEHTETLIAVVQAGFEVVVKGS
jgi:quercetin dioxygenase-like cupin family protein